MEARAKPARQLIDLLSRVPGVVLPPQSKQILSSWWKFPLSIDEATIGVTTDEFCEALRVEGVRIMRRYLSRPLFEEEMLRCRRTYGQSGYPFSAVDYVPPDVRNYAGLSEFNNRWLLLEWSSRVKPHHVQGIFAAVQKAIGQLGRSSGAAADDRDAEIGNGDEMENETLVAASGGKVMQP